MAVKQRPTLNDLRVTVTANQRSMLDAMWQYWLDEKKTITAIALYNKFGKEVVESAVRFRR